jgi:hypothetical protein
VAKFTIPAPLSIITCCDSSIVGFKIFSLSNFALISPNKMIKKPALIPHKNCLLCHHLSPHLVHAHSEE